MLDQGVTLCVARLRFIRDARRQHPLDWRDAAAGMREMELLRGVVVVAVVVAL